MKKPDRVPVFDSCIDGMDVFVHWYQADEMDAYIESEIARLKALPPQWVSVDERLPDQFDSVIVSYKNKAASDVIVCDSYLEHLGFCIRFAKTIKPIVGVTHWMPLPPAPGAAK